MIGRLPALTLFQRQAIVHGTQRQTESVKPPAPIPRPTEINMTPSQTNKPPGVGICPIRAIPAGTTVTAPAESIDALAIDLAEPGQALVCVERRVIGGDAGGEENIPKQST